MDFDDIVKKGYLMGDTGKGPNVRPGPRKRTNTGCITCRFVRMWL